jgi:zinc transporter 1/2/3
MESGVIFHSICTFLPFILALSTTRIVLTILTTVIGINLSVTPNSFYNTLFVVIIFHQMFEGIALGIRIAGLKSGTSTLIKFIMAGAFTVITPIGMAIGVAVLDTFNGNDPTTIVTTGTLNALSAGILLWVGLVEMLAQYVYLLLFLSPYRLWLL